jgi:hypothetical protein
MEKLGGDPFFSIPFTNFTPFITSAKRSGRCKRIHLFSAHWYNLNAIVITVLPEKQPLTLAVLNRTVAKVDSLGLVVRICRQCSAGKS